MKLFYLEILNLTLDVLPGWTSKLCREPLTIAPAQKIVTCLERNCTMKVDRCTSVFQSIRTLDENNFTSIKSKNKWLLFQNIFINNNFFTSSFNIHSECGKMRTRITQNTVTFYVVSFTNFLSRYDTYVVNLIFCLRATKFSIDSFLINVSSMEKPANSFASAN